MRVLIIGATGLIGSAVCARLHASGHDVIAAVRSLGVPARRLPAAGYVTVDLRLAAKPDFWLPHLTNIDAVVNCAGVLQDSPRDSTQRVHVEGPNALFQACTRAGVRRVVHLSAIGLDRETPTEFSRTKLAGDGLLMALDLDWVILRPSVVVGRAAYGGSALFRGLAALPVLPIFPGTGLLQIVQLDDVTKTVELMIAPNAPSRFVLELAGPQRLGFEDVVQKYRRWLGWRPARTVKAPAAFANLAFMLGDLIGALGWRPPIRSTAKREILRGAIGDSSEWMRITGIEPLSFDAALAREPASVQERWFSRLYLLKPAILAVLSLFWIVTGILSLGPAREAGTELARAAGAGPLALPVIIAGGLVDLLVGGAIAIRRTARIGLCAALIVTIFYLICATLLVPSLWGDPLGSMLKIFPILMLNVVALAILDDR